MRGKVEATLGLDEVTKVAAKSPLGKRCAIIAIHTHSENISANHKQAPEVHCVKKAPRGFPVFLIGVRANQFFNLEEWLELVNDFFSRPDYFHS